MHLHPVVAALTLFWFGAVGVFAAIVTFLAQDTSILVFIAAGMFMFGVLLVVVSFYPEAVKARCLVEQGIAAGA